MKEEYYIAKEGESYRSIKEDFVLKVVKESGRFINVCVVAGNRNYRVGDVPILTEEDALKFNKANFERYYYFNDYLKQVEL